MNIINTYDGINGLKMRIIRRLIRSLPIHDDYAFVIIGLCRARFHVVAEVYGRSDVESYLGRPLTDGEWDKVRGSQEWQDLDESMYGYDILRDAVHANVEVF